MNFKQMEKILATEPKYRLKQAVEHVCKKLATSWDSANLPKELKEKLNQVCPLEIKGEIIELKKDQALKAILDFDGNQVEAVLMKHGDGRRTACLSSQIGCPLACDFCATGEMGFKRNLSKEEIVAQFIFLARELKKDKELISNIVFMGMGEPFLNYEQVMAAIKIFNDKEKFNIGARRISISTAGITEGIKKLSKEPLQINLAFSLQAADNELRGKLMPINKKYKLEKVLPVIRDYIDKSNRKVMIEYVLLKGVNDSLPQAQKLARLLKEELGTLFVVNLIPFNQTDKKYQASDKKTITDFKEALNKNKIATVERFAFGQDIKGACGQLGLKK